MVLNEPFYSGKSLSMRAGVMLTHAIAYVLLVSTSLKSERIRQTRTSVTGGFIYWSINGVESLVIFQLERLDGSQPHILPGRQAH